MANTPTTPDTPHNHYNPHNSHNPHSPITLIKLVTDKHDNSYTFPNPPDGSQRLVAVFGACIDVSVCAMQIPYNFIHALHVNLINLNL